LDCKFGKHNYWYSQGAFRCKKCGHVTYKSHRRKNKNTVIILASIIVAVGIIGYFTFQTYATPQNIQNEANKIITNTENKIQQISPQLTNLSSSQNKPFPLTSEDNRVPIVVYDNCQSFIRSDLKTIDTTCNLPPPTYQKTFKFDVPDVLEQKIQPAALFNVKTKVYQYGTTDFKIGLYDQTGEKNYTVTLWQFPQ